jgi:hypothetical protein
MSMTPFSISEVEFWMNPTSLSDEDLSEMSPNKSGFVGSEVGSKLFGLSEAESYKEIIRVYLKYFSVKVQYQQQNFGTVLC